MKDLPLFLLIVIILSSAQCNREGENCHYEIEIRNESQDTVMFGGRKYVTEAGCGFDFITWIPPTSSFYFPNRHCWESEITSVNFRYVLFSPNVYSAGNTFPCDSSDHYALIQYNLTLEEVQAMNFKITYP